MRQSINWITAFLWNKEQKNYIPVMLSNAAENNVIPVMKSSVKLFANAKAILVNIKAMMQLSSMERAGLSSIAIATYPVCVAFA